MSWMRELGGLLEQYTGATAANAPASAVDDFDRATQVAPREELADGLAESFRSPQTPPFPQMLAELFGHTGATQRAGILNTLLATAGPALLSGALARYGLGTRVTPEQAAHLPPEAVAEAAAVAEQHDPTIVERISSVYAEHPELIKHLGAAALTVALARIVQKQRGR